MNELFDNKLVAIVKSVKRLLLLHIHKKFQVNWTKIKGSCQSGRKVVTHDSKSDLPLGLSHLEEVSHFSQITHTPQSYQANIILIMTDRTPRA